MSLVKMTLVDRDAKTPAPVNTLVEEAYRLEAEKDYRDRAGNSPHGRAWHLSFHASAFNNDDSYCPRKDVYTLMNVPGATPFTRQGMAIMNAGSDIEHRIVTNLGKQGFLLSAMPDESRQTGFVDAENWVTGNCDGVVAIPYEPAVHVLEIKTKQQEVVSAMIRGDRGPDPSHVKQLRTYIGYLNRQFYSDENLHRLRRAYLCQHCEKITALTQESSVRVCPEHGEVHAADWVDKKFLPPTKGSLYYVSRDTPAYVKEFIVELDPDHVPAGIANVQIAKTHFEAGTLPPRPVAWEGWSKNACQYCPMKKFACRPDEKEGVEKLEDSHGIDFAKSVNETYDYEETRATVLEYWRKKNE